MKCDVKIMGCAARVANMRALMAKIGLSFADAAIDWQMARNPLATSMSAFRLPHAADVTHRLVVQDDINVCENLPQFANHLVAIAPEAVFSLYCNSPKLADYPDGTIIKTGGTVHGPAVIMPLKYVDDIYAKWQERAPQYKHDDRLYSRYFNQHGIPVYTVAPNVVTLLDLPSEMRHGGLFKNCRADLGDPMRFDWQVRDGDLGRRAEANDIILT